MEYSPNPKGQLTTDEINAIQHFSELLLDMAKALSPENQERKQYFKEKIIQLEKIVSYKYPQLEEDIKTGNIPKEEQFMYLAMDLFMKKPDNALLVSKLEEFVGYIHAIKRDRDFTRDAVDTYKKLFMNMAFRITLMDINVQIGKKH